MAAMRGIGFIRNQYEIIEEIGQGGMGIVYKAHDTQLERDVAIKVILPHLSQQPEFKQVFEKEAKALATLQHPNIISIYDFQSVKRGSYYVMPYIQGQTLKELIDTNSITAEFFLLASKALLSALEFAHKKNILHRDIKPANIFINEDGQVFLGDFGVIAQDFTHSQITTSQQVAFHGTPAYASPEQIEGISLSSAADIYSLGVVFYEMLTGRPPFSGNLNSVISAQLTKNVPPIDTNTLDPQLKHLPVIIEKMLKKSPLERPQSCHDIVYLLEHPEEVVAQQTVTAEIVEQALSQTVPLEQKATQLGTSIEATKQKFEETEKLLEQLLANQEKIDKTMYGELKRKYRKTMDQQVETMEKLLHDAHTCVTEFDLRLKNNGHAIKKLAQELNGYKLLQANSEDETDYSEKIQRAEDGLVPLRRKEEQLQQQHDALKKSITKAAISRKQTQAEKILSYTATVVASFVGFFLVYILYLALTTTPARVRVASATIFKKPSVLSPSIGRAWEKELAVIDKRYRRRRNEGVVVRNSFLEVGINLLPIAKGERVLILKKFKDRYLVSYRQKGRGTIAQARIRKTAVRKNSWYRIKTESGARGWVFSEQISPWRKASFIKKFVFSLQNFFSVRSKRSEQVTRQARDLEPIRKVIKNKKQYFLAPHAAGQYKSDFFYYLDLQGANAIATALAKEIHLASLTGLASRVDTLEKIREKFVAEEYGHARSMIKAVYLVGPFNSWSPTADLMSVRMEQGVALFSYNGVLSIPADKMEYGFFFKLVLDNRNVMVYVPDPMNEVASKDFYKRQSFLQLPGKKIKTKIIKLAPASVNASSVANDSSTLNLSDDLVTSSWVSSTLNGGVGSKLVFRFPRKVLLSEIIIFNGHSKAEEFFKYNRVARLQVTMDKHKTVLVLRDYVKGKQQFILKKARLCKVVSLTVDAVYAGNPGQQTAISEIVFNRRR